jgi:chromate reductase
VGRSDALLIVTPEYNHGLPGVMKNTFDWLSRPSRESVLDGKLTAIMGASNGVIGTARSQLQLRQSLASTNTPTLLRPQVLVGRAQEKFDAEGRLTDEATRKFLVAFLDEFARWIKHMSATPGSGA